MSAEDEKIWPNLPTGRAPLAVGELLLSLGPGVLKEIRTYPNGAKEPRFGYVGDDHHNKGPNGEHNSHREGRAMDINLYVSSPRDYAEALKIIAILRSLSNEMHWSTLIYNKQEWGRNSGPKPRIFRAPTTAETTDKDAKAKYAKHKIDFEHTTHIHLEWDDSDKNLDDFRDEFSAALTANKAALDNIDAIPGLIKGEWKIVWGNDEFTGYMQFSADGAVTYSDRSKGRVTDNGRWEIESTKLAWRFKGPSDPRTFTVPLPLAAHENNGVILPTGLGWFKMMR